MDDAENLHGLTKFDAEILHNLIFRLIHYFYYNYIHDAGILYGLKKLDAEILHDLIFCLIHYFFYNNYMMQKFYIA